MCQKCIFMVVHQSSSKTWKEAKRDAFLMSNSQKDVGPRHVQRLLLKNVPKASLVFWCNMKKKKNSTYVILLSGSALELQGNRPSNPSNPKPHHFVRQSQRFNALLSRNRWRKEKRLRTPRVHLGSQHWPASPKAGGLRPWSHEGMRWADANDTFSGSGSVLVDPMLANPFSPYSIQKHPEPQMCPKFVPAIVFGGSSPGEWNLSKICQNLKSDNLDKFWQIFDLFQSPRLDPQKQSLGQILDKFGVRGVLNAVRRERVRNPMHNRIAQAKLRWSDESS